jgi:hypothetical protein
VSKAHNLTKPEAHLQQNGLLYARASTSPPFMLQALGVDCNLVYPVGQYRTAPRFERHLSYKAGAVSRDPRYPDSRVSFIARNRDVSGITSLSWVASAFGHIAGYLISSFFLTIEIQGLSRHGHVMKSVALCWFRAARRGAVRQRPKVASVAYSVTNHILLVKRF